MMLTSSILHIFIDINTFGQFCPNKENQMLDILSLLVGVVAGALLVTLVPAIATWIKSKV
jgi:hypothetical protein